MTMFFILVAIQGVLLLYHDPTPEHTQIWDFVTDMSQWSSTAFILTFLGIAAGIGLVGVAASTIFGFKTDFLILAGAVGGIMTMGVVMTNLAKVIQSDLIAYVFTTCSTAAPTACAPVNLILALTIGPFALFFIWTVIEWWRGKDY